MCAPSPHTQFSCINVWLASGLPWRPDSKESAYGAGDPGSVAGSGRSPGEGHGYPLQYSCLENPMDRGAWWATVHGGHKESDRLSDFTFIFSCVWGTLSPSTTNISMLLRDVYTDTLSPAPSMSCVPRV